MEDTPNIMISPGDLIKKELQSRMISQKDLAESLGIGTSHMSEIIKGSRKIPISLIPKIADFLEMSEADLLEIVSRVELKRKKEALATEEEIKMEELLSKYDEIVNVAVLLKKAGLARKSTSAEKINTLINYYGLSDIETTKNNFKNLSERCFRRSSATGLDTRMIATWVIEAEAASKKQKPKEEFMPEKIQDLTTDLYKVFHENHNTLEKVKSLLYSHGIGFSVVEKEQRASIDGYSFFHENHPYIVVTCRFNRIDNLAFTVMHELGHIKLGHVQEGCPMINIDCNTDEDITEISKEEAAADEFATESLIPKRLWNLAPRVTLDPFVIQQRYTEWAKKNTLNRWIVLGRVSHETGMYRFKSDDSRKIN